MNKTIKDLYREYFGGNENFMWYLDWLLGDYDCSLAEYLRCQ